MTHEIIMLHDVQIIGMAKEIAFNKGHEECPKFWGEYVERIIRPVIFEKKEPDAFQQAALANGVGEFGLCTCNTPNHHCITCGAENFGTCNNRTFVYSSADDTREATCPKECACSPFQAANG